MVVEAGGNEDDTLDTVLGSESFGGPDGNSGSARLADGRLLCFYVHRHPPGSMRLIMSTDDGKSWDKDNELVVYESVGPTEAGFGEHSDYATYWEDMGVWFFRHPAGVVLRDGTVLLAHYGGPDDKCLSVRWTRVRV